jgi:hypothetical protein
MRITSPKTRKPIPVHMIAVPFYSMRIVDVNEIIYAIFCLWRRPPSSRASSPPYPQQRRQ